MKLIKLYKSVNDTYLIKRISILKKSQERHEILVHDFP